MKERGIAWDVLLAALLSVLALALLATLTRQLPAALFARAQGFDAWFQADMPRVLANMVDAGSNHYRTKVHPIASILIHPAVSGLRLLWPGSDLQAAMRFIGAVAVLWVFGFYALCRLLGCGRFAAACFSLMAIGSAGFLFWFSVPETYAPGSLTLLWVLLVAALAAHRPVSDRLIVGASIASLAITITNWVAGLALAVVQRPWRRALGLSAIAFAVVAALTVPQRLLYSYAKFFFLGSREELDYMNLKESGTWLDKLAGMFWSTFSLPEVLALPADQLQQLPQLTVQLSSPGSGGWIGMAALGLWTLLLLAGAWGLARSPEWRRFAAVLGLTLAAQVLLHLVYGEETFLYAAHFLPLLMAVAVFSIRVLPGGLAASMALLAAALAAFHNTAVYEAAVRLLQQAH
ncbi:hypothetical protein [Variovorax sp. JS1663]|uniref:hypothetical protein n=1 Tax=Variovorax sp. JS1663 TaxID=1851577 RepID=UPI000B346F03|nr:hypothetical protein [Variovorax sp. JS1663]OUM03753.1 hypothetical protein A8M77_04380 [Variovorax sp. JS1663]